MTTLASIVTTRLAVVQTGTATTSSSNSFFTFVQVGFGCLVVLLVLFWLSLVSGRFAISVRVHTSAFLGSWLRWWWRCFSWVAG